VSKELQQEDSLHVSIRLDAISAAHVEINTDLPPSELRRLSAAP
jgi:hypothetical protein